MKKFFKKFREPLVKKELKKFLLEGFLGAIVFGSMLGTVDYFFNVFNMNFLSFFTFLIFYIFITRRLYRSFHFYHIIYSVLAVFFVILGDYFISVSHQVIFLLLETGKILPLVFSPLFQFRFLFYWPPDVVHIIVNILNIIIYLLICFLTYNHMKR